MATNKTHENHYKNSHHETVDLKNNNVLNVKLKDETKKTCCEKLELLFPSLMAVIITGFFSCLLAHTATVIQQNNIREEVLSNYSEEITRLFTQDDFSQKLKKDLATGQTFITLKRLNEGTGELKGLLIRFLYTSKLIGYHTHTPDPQLESRKPQIALGETDLTKLVLKDAWLPDIILEGAYMSLSDMRNTSLIRANLKRATLLNADLTKSDLRQADLQDASLRKAKLNYADLRKANLRGANLRNIKDGDVININVIGTLYDRETKFPDDGNLQQKFKDMAYLIEPETDLSFQDLSIVNLQAANLQRANLQGANLQRANLQGANLQRANLQGANLQAAKLSNAQLQKANLRGANLRNINDEDVININVEGTLYDANTKFPYRGNLQRKFKDMAYFIN